MGHKTRANIDIKNHKRIGTSVQPHPDRLRSSTSFSDDETLLMIVSALADFISKASRLSLSVLLIELDMIAIPSNNKI